MKMQCYFPLNVKHGASQLYLGGASNYLAPALNDLIIIGRFGDESFQASLELVLITHNIQEKIQQNTQK